MFRMSNFGIPKILGVILALASFALPSLAQGPPSSFPYAYPVQNDPTTGTVQFSAVKINSSGNAIVLATTDTNGYAGICVANCGTTGTAWIAFAGIVPVTADNTATAQHYVVYPTTTNGRGKDSGATTFPLAQGIIGRVVTGASTGAQAMVNLAPPEINTLGLFIAGSDFCQDAGSTDAYACNLSPAITAYTTGAHYRFKANTANTTVATIAFNGLSAITIKKAPGGITTDLATNDILVGQWVDLVYDGTNMQMQSLLGNAAAGGSSSWSGITDPSASVTHVMGSNLTEFDYTTALADAWKLAANITVATVTTPQNSPIVKLVCGTDWTGAGASTQGCLTAQYTPGTGLNAQALIALGISDSSTNTNNGFSLNGNLYLPAGGKVGINSQGNENAQFSAGGISCGSGTRCLAFFNAGNVDAGAIDGSFSRVGVGLLGVGTGAAGNMAGFLKTGNATFVTSNFTTAANTSLQTITGLSWSVPANAVNYMFACHVAYSQGTAAAAVGFGIQAATNAPTNIFARGIIYTSTTVFTTGVLATLATTTATQIVSATPSATATNFVADISGTIENGATANALNIMVSTATSADAVTILRGSYCTFN